MRLSKIVFIFIIWMTVYGVPLQAQITPDKIKFTRQASKRLVFDENQTIPLAGILPDKIIGFPVMHPIAHHLKDSAVVSVMANHLVVQSQSKTETDIWLGGFNPVATYSIDLATCIGKGALGFSFSGKGKKEKLIIKAHFNNQKLNDVILSFTDNEGVTTQKSIAVNLSENTSLKGTLYLQMLGSGLAQCGPIARRLSFSLCCLDDG